MIIERDNSSDIVNAMAVQSMVDYNREVTLERLRESREDYRESPRQHSSPVTESYSSSRSDPDPPSYSSPDPDPPSYSSDTNNDIGGGGGGDIGGGDSGGGGGGDI